MQVKKCKASDEIRTHPALCKASFIQLCWYETLPSVGQISLEPLQCS